MKTGQGEIKTWHWICITAVLYLAIGLAVALSTMGCAAPQAGNPSDIETEIEDSHSNSVTSIQVIINRGAEVDQSEMLRDVLRELTIPLVQAAEGLIPKLSESGGELTPPPAGDPDGAEGSGLPSPSPGLPPSGDLSGDQTFLWKPVSENSGKLVVLTPAGLDGVRASWAGETASGTRNGKNGNRQHWRFAKPGGAYPPGEFRLLLRAGREVSWQISNPGQRWQSQEVKPGGTEATEGTEGEASEQPPAVEETPEEPADPPAVPPVVEGNVILWERPFLVLPDAWGVQRVVVYEGRLGGRLIEQQRGNFGVVRLSDDAARQAQITVQMLWTGGAALGDLTFDPREPYGGPPTIVYIGDGKPWPAGLPGRFRYAPTAEQGPGSTKYKLLG